MLGLCLADHALAPEGNGLDTHRFWECAAVGCTPVRRGTAHLLAQLYEYLFSVRAMKPYVTLCDQVLSGCAAAVIRQLERRSPRSAAPSAPHAAIALAARAPKS